MNNINNIIRVANDTVSITEPIRRTLLVQKQKAGLRTYKSKSDAKGVCVIDTTYGAYEKIVVVLHWGKRGLALLSKGRWMNVTYIPAATTKTLLKLLTKEVKRFTGVNLGEELATRRQARQVGAVPQVTVESENVLRLKSLRQEIKEIEAPYVYDFFDDEPDVEILEMRQPMIFQLRILETEVEDLVRVNANILVPTQTIKVARKTASGIGDCEYWKQSFPLFDTPVKESYFVRKARGVTRLTDLSQIWFGQSGKYVSKLTQGIIASSDEVHHIPVLKHLLQIIPPQILWEHKDALYHVGVSINITAADWKNPLPRWEQIVALAKIYEETSSYGDRQLLSPFAVQESESGKKRHLLNDTLRMLRRLPADIQGIPMPTTTNVNKLHDGLVDVLRQIKAAQNTWAYHMTFEARNEVMHVFTAKTQGEVDSWGTTQHHCIGSYKDDVSTLVLQVETAGEELAHIALSRKGGDKWKFIQMYHSRNRLVAPNLKSETLKLIGEHLTLVK